MASDGGLVFSSWKEVRGTMPQDRRESCECRLAMPRSAPQHAGHADVGRCCCPLMESNPGALWPHHMPTEQIKQHAGSKHKHLKFYLVDGQGRDHLAVEAHDQVRLCGDQVAACHACAYLVGMQHTPPSASVHLRGTRTTPTSLRPNLTSMALLTATTEGRPSCGELVGP
jgi:hypothetical protein